MRNTRCRGLHTGGLTEEVVFLRGRQRGMGIGRADHAEFVGIGAELLLKREAELQGLACILSRQHVRRFEFRDIEIANVPGSIVGKFIIG